ncbi:MAG: NAD(P)-dependent oxidoreductase [Phycisphaerae bacterium]|nr:NAD(P)-dependent oxidoreductase [Phycisphaerae bacterium]
MNVHVTGGSGLVGGYAIQELLDHGIDVVNVDLHPSKKHPKVPFRKADLTDAGATRRAIRDAEAVVHLAAIPNPNNDPGERVMAVNMVLTHNVLEAVRESKIRRIVYGCSESASGFGIHRVEHVPLYVPIDEAHPSWPHETYSFTKYFGEVMCREYARADKIEVVSLRYGWVWFREHEDALRKTVRHRGDQGFRRHLGAYVFAEDVGQAIRLSLSYDFAGAAMPFEAFYVLAAEPIYSGPTLEAIRNAFGDATPPVKPADYFEKNPRASAFSIEKARRLLGYEPQFTCEDL